MSNSWKEYKISDAPVSIIDGDRGKNYPKQNEFFEDGYCLFLNANNVTKEGFSFNSTHFITKDKDKTLRSGKLCRDDIVLTTRGTIGNVAFYNNKIKFDNVRINSGMVIIRCDKKKISPSYLYQYLRSELFQVQIHAFKSGVAQPQLPICDIKRMTLLIPSLIDQRKIASILSAYDDLIENNTRRIQILEEMARRIYQEWFVNFRFPGHEKVKFVDSELGKIPEGWKIEQLDKYVDFERGVEPGSDNYEKYGNKENIPFLRVGDLGNRRIEIYVNRSLTKGKIINEDDIVVSMDGTPGIIKMGLFGCYSTGIRKLVIKDKVMKKSFLYFLMMSEHIKNIIKAHSKGTTILHASESIEHMNFILPDNNLMKSFDDMASLMIREILLFNKKNKILRETRDLLLPKLISGELDVSDLDIKIREEKL